MSYIVFWTTNDYEKHTVNVHSEEVNDFVEMMNLFTLLSSSKDNVIVIEPDTKKVVCHYISEGKVTFNKYLLDTTLFANSEED